MMRVKQGLYLVCSGAAGFDVSDPLDCNTWLLDTGDGFALFDAGAGRDPDAVVAAIAGEGIDPQAVRWLLLTHGHADHAGGTAALRERLGCAVLAGPATAKLVESGDRVGISLDRAIERGMYPADFVFHRCPVTRPVAPGEVFSLGRLTIEVIATPGHSHDHMCFMVHDGDAATLVAGDAVFAGGRVALQDIYDCSVAETCESIRQLAGRCFETFLPGHGVFSLQRGDRHVRRALERIQRLLPPELFP